MKDLIIYFLLSLIPSLTVCQSKSYVGIIGGIDVSYRSLTITEGNRNLEIVKGVRDNSEKAKVNWRLGGDYHRSLSERISLKLGARISSVGYVLKNSSLTWGTQHNGMGGWTTDPNLPQSYKLSEDFLFIEIPVTIRYWLNNSNIRMYLESGLYPAIYLTTRQSVKLDEETNTTYERYDFNTFNNLQFVGLFSVGFEKKLKNNNGMFLQPTFRYHLTKMADAQIKENLFNYGMEMGYRISIK